MNRSRGGSAGSPVPEHDGPSAKPRANRLSRGLRGAQGAEPEPAGRRAPGALTSGFRTPSRLRPSRASSDESPHNDSDLQQDIVWDAASPSPLRAGKRGRKAVARVDISEIVSRIAPKHGRPAVAEPTLQQWIGDSAAIPCTPDVPLVKAKRKSPRLNAVNNLLQLAKQFDFSMFRQDHDQDHDQDQDQDQDHDQDQDQQSLDLLSQDIFDSRAPRSPTAAPPLTAASHQLLDDDLDFLFDGPTQRLSGHLSQFPAKGASGKPPASGEPEDDWESDDFLNDSLLLEMTQNPPAFALPKLCSTQKPCGGGAYGQSACSKVAQQDSTGSITVRVQSRANLAAGSQTPRPAAPTWPPQPRGGAYGGLSQSARSKVAQQDSSRSVAVPVQSHTDLAATVLTPVSLWSNQRSHDAPAATKTAHNLPSESPTAHGFLDDDLDSLFSCEPAWDDPADVPTERHASPVLQAAHQRGGPGAGQNRQPACGRGGAAANQQPACGHGGAAAAASSSGARNPLRNAEATSSRKQLEETEPGRAAWTFKKPNRPVSMATSRAARCSEAEIELKKQQAMERRRHRLQEIHNLPPPAASAGPAPYR